MAKTSPTQKAGALLKRLGYLVTITEKWNAFAKIRQDAWGFVDLIAIKEGCKPLYLQVTSWGGTTDRYNKIVTGGDDKLSETRLAAAKILCSSSSAQVEVWGFKPGRTPRTKDNLKRVRITYGEDGFSRYEQTCNSSDMRPAK